MSLFCTHSRSVTTPGNCPMLSPQPCSHTQDVHHTHTTIRVNQHNVMPASTPLTYVPHVYSTTCTMCTQYQMFIASHAWHVPYPHVFQQC